MLKGLASDGGLFLPEEIPVAEDWVRRHHITQVLELKKTTNKTI